MAAIAAATATVMLQPLPFFVVSFVVSFPTSSSIFASVVEGMLSMHDVPRTVGVSLDSFRAKFSIKRFSRSAAPESHRGTRHATAWLFVRKKGSHESKWLWNELVCQVCCTGTQVRDAESMHLYDTARVGSRERS